MKKKKSRKELESFEVEMESLKLQSAVSENLIEEGSSLLKTCKKKMHIPTFTEVQQKIEMGLKRKSELQLQIQSLEKKKRVSQ